MPFPFSVTVRPLPRYVLLMPKLAGGTYRVNMTSDTTTIIWNVDIPANLLGGQFRVFVNDSIGSMGDGELFTVAPGRCTSTITTTTNLIATQSQTTSQISALPGTTPTSIDERKANQAQTSRYVSSPQFGHSDSV